MGYPGLSLALQPWDHHFNLAFNPERVRLATNPFRVGRSLLCVPRVVAGAPTLGWN